MLRTSLAALAVVSAFSFSAHAHVSLASGPAFADKSQKITFSVGHGCEGSDTVKVEIEIPTQITSVRGLASDFGKVTVTRDPNDTNAATNIRRLTWTKPAGTELDEDVGFYEITLRGKVANQPFTQVQINVHQTCANGAEEHWTAAPGASGSPAPILKVVPSRLAGWNKVIVPVAIAKADLPTYFGDALIVWKGTSAFSSNANTRAMILGTTGVTELDADLAVGDEVWVKY